MSGSAIENSCITKYVYQVLNKIINQSINDTDEVQRLMGQFSKFSIARDFIYGMIKNWL